VLDGGEEFEPFAKNLQRIQLHRVVCFFRNVWNIAATKLHQMVENPRDGKINAGKSG
jgi:hypothetical protein